MWRLSCSCWMYYKKLNKKQTIVAINFRFSLSGLNVSRIFSISILDNWMQVFESYCGIKIILKIATFAGASPTAEGLIKSESKAAAVQINAVRPKQQLLYLADVLGFQVQFTDFPKVLLFNIILILTRLLAKTIVVRLIYVETCLHVMFALALR